VRSSSEVVMQITKHTVIYSDSGPLLGGNSTTSNSLILKMNICYKVLAECLRSSRGEGENVSHTPYLEDRGTFIDRSVVC
jgi:hypothetical protein